LAIVAQVELLLQQTFVPQFVEIAEGLGQKFEMMETHHQMMGETLAVKLRLDGHVPEVLPLLKIPAVRYEVTAKDSTHYRPTVTTEIQIMEMAEAALDLLK
jgi:phage portal protein BeeE